MRDDLASAIEKHRSAFAISLNSAQIGRLADYYELVQEHNPLLHLVAPCSAEEFATRHILESLTLLEFLPENTRFADVGAGAGLPSIPCLLVREDLSADLIESKIKKSAFLEAAIEKLELTVRASVRNRQFEETRPGEASVITCRALDKFSEKLPRLIKWSKGRPLLLFAGPDLRAEIEKFRTIDREQLMPLSARRYLFVTK
jgi:16S rRNA (guanine527-N7)-methyltransferase